MQEETPKVEGTTTDEVDKVIEEVLVEGTEEDLEAETD